MAGAERLCFALLKHLPGACVRVCVMVCCPGVWDGVLCYLLLELWQFIYTVLLMSQFTSVLCCGFLRILFRAF